MFARNVTLHVKADKAPEPLGRSIWVGKQVSPNGDTVREHVLRFVDGKHLVWSVTQSAPWVRVTSTRGNGSPTVTAIDG